MLGGYSEVTATILQDPAKTLPEKQICGCLTALSHKSPCCPPHILPVNILFCPEKEHSGHSHSLFGHHLPGLWAVGVSGEQARGIRAWEQMFQNSGPRLARSCGPLSRKSNRVGVMKWHSATTGNSHPQAFTPPSNLPTQGGRN